MEDLKCDSKGRLYLSQSLRRLYGARFIAVPAPGEIVLIPVPKDAVKDFRDATRKARGKSIRQLKAMIAREAHRQAVA